MGSHKGFIKDWRGRALQQGEDTKEFTGGTVTNQLRLVSGALADMAGRATMPDGATEAASGDGQKESVQTQLAQLVPSYDPGVDSVETWSQKIQLLFGKHGLRIDWSS